MKKSPSIRKKLQEIFETGAFERLKTYKNEEKWEKLSIDDRELLGTLFVMQGEKQLKNGEPKKVKDIFSMACRVAPKSPRIYYRQALAYACDEMNPTLLPQACHALEQATALNPGFFDAWMAWGVVLIKLGDFYAEASYYEDAVEKFSHAETLLGMASTLRRGEFYHHFANALTRVGAFSGEAIDYSHASEKFKKAHEAGVNTARFWSDFAVALVELAYLVNKVDLLFEGLEYDWRAVQIDGQCQEAWLHLAYHLEKLFCATSQESFFGLAKDAFENALRFEENNATFWHRWGQLLTHYGKSRRNLDVIDEACLKFEAANRLEPNHPKILSSWAEAKLLLGAHDDSIEELKQAEALVLNSIEMERENSAHWGLWGSILFEIGRYFEDPSYIKTASEKFQFAISLNKKNYLLWHGLTQCYYVLGDMQEDYRMLERAARLSHRVIEMGGRPFPQYWNDWGVILVRLFYMTNDRHYLELAVNRFRHVMKLASQDADTFAVDPEWLFNLGTALDTLGEIKENTELLQEAHEALDKLVEVARYYPHAYGALGLTTAHLAELNRDVDLFIQACEDFQEASEIDPDAEYIYLEWGLTLIMIARLLNEPATEERAKEFFFEADRVLRLALRKGSVTALYYIGTVYAMRDQITEAVDCLERLREHGALPPVKEIMADQWYATLIETNEFKAFLNRVKEA